MRKIVTERQSLGFETLTDQVRHENERRTNAKKIANHDLERQSPNGPPTGQTASMACIRRNSSA